MFVLAQLARVRPSPSLAVVLLAALSLLALSAVVTVLVALLTLSLALASSVLLIPLLLLARLLVLRVSVAHVLVLVGLVMLRRPLVTSASGSVSSPRGVSALLVVAHLVVLLLSVLATTSPTALILSCHNQSPVKIYGWTLLMRTGRSLTEARAGAETLHL